MIGPATGAFVVVLTVVGAVTRAFGVDAGLLALVLAVVALVLFPRLYGTAHVGELDRPAREADPNDRPTQETDADDRPVHETDTDDGPARKQG